MPFYNCTVCKYTFGIQMSLSHLLFYSGNILIFPQYLWATIRGQCGGRLAGWDLNALMRDLPFPSCFPPSLPLFFLLFWDHCRSACNCNNIGRSDVPFAQFPSVEAFCKIIVQDHSQDINIDMSKYRTFLFDRDLLCCLLYSHSLVSHPNSVISRMFIHGIIQYITFGIDFSHSA